MSSTTVQSDTNIDFTAYQCRVTEKGNIMVYSKNQTIEMTREEIQALGILGENSPIVKTYLPLKDENGKVVARVDNTGKILSGDISKISDESKNKMEKFIRKTEQFER